MFLDTSLKDEIETFRFGKMKVLEAFIFMIGIATLTTLSFVSGQQVEDESNVEQNNKRNVSYNFVNFFIL